MNASAIFSLPRVPAASIDRKILYHLFAAGADGVAEIDYANDAVKLSGIIFRLRICGWLIKPGCATQDQRAVGRRYILDVRDARESNIINDLHEFISLAGIERISVAELQIERLPTRYLGNLSSGECTGQLGLLAPLPENRNPRAPTAMGSARGPL